MSQQIFVCNIRIKFVSIGVRITYDVVNPIYDVKSIYLMYTNLSPFITLTFSLVIRVNP